MRIKIIYFSGTGNTKFLSEKMTELFREKGIRDVELAPIETALSDFKDLEGEDMILGIGYPVYDYMPPKSVMEFVNKLEKRENHSGAFVFCTYTTNPLDSNYYLIEKLQAKGYHVIAQDNYKAPGASSFLYANPKNPLVKGKTVFSKGIDQELHGFVASILDLAGDRSGEIPIRYNRFNKFHQALSRMTFGNLLYRDLKKNSSCINCGVCAKTCPDGNLIMNDGILNIRNSNDCTRCLRCVLACPKMAINFTSSKRTGIYSGEMMEKAYENAIAQE